MSCSPEPAQTSRRQWLGATAAGFFGALARAENEELRQLPPKDEAARDRNLAAFLNRLRDMTDRRDFRSLETLQSPTFRVEFDVGKGPKAFHGYWRPETPSSKLWPVMSRLLGLGGTFYSGTLFALSYVYTRFPQDLSLADHVVALREDVALLDAPAAGAKRVGVLEHSIIQLAEPLTAPFMLEDGRYLKVGHPTAGACYVAAADVYSPAAHRAFFEKRQGQWRWISLAAATLKDPPIPKGSVNG